MRNVEICKSFAGEMLFQSRLEELCCLCFSFFFVFFILLLLVFPLGKKKGLPRPNERIKRKSNFDEDGKFSASKVGEERDRELFRGGTAK